MKLVIDSLKSALISLEKAVDISIQKEKDKSVSQDELDVIQAGVIQNFEFTYELCWKFMKRWIEVNIGATYVDGVTRIELFRQASENRLISDVEKWVGFHRARNETSHIYDEEIAKFVYETAKVFLDDAKKFLKALEERND